MQRPRRLLLDENISPRICADLWALNVDVAHLRDRGMLGAPDHLVFRAALREDRMLVTINEGDFRRICARSPAPCPLIVLPSGGTAVQQFQRLRAALSQLDATTSGPDWALTYLRVENDLTIGFPRLSGE